jgi:hypothetical protein
LAHSRRERRDGIFNEGSIALPILVAITTSVVGQAKPPTFELIETDVHPAEGRAALLQVHTPRRSWPTSGFDTAQHRRQRFIVILVTANLVIITKPNRFHCGAPRDVSIMQLAPDVQKLYDVGGYRLFTSLPSAHCARRHTKKCRSVALLQAERFQAPVELVSVHSSFIEDGKSPVNTDQKSHMEMYIRLIRSGFFSA